jgi:23S rRNA (cytidine1920-2'-O)/16S rRNA (cytidine1409-2'-O)-methyltransferase
VDKPGTNVPTDAQISVKARSPYVSRGGQKLAKALQTFPIQVQNRVCLDGGISTGGFTDCLLQSGAKLVYGVDVGYGQVAWKLRTDPRVVLKERTNLRQLLPQDLYAADADLPDLGVVDVSFISLTKVLPALRSLLQSPKEAILLVKPQFEVGKTRIGKNGVVRNPKDQATAIAAVLDASLELGWRYGGITWSPLVGPAGNIEFLLWLGERCIGSPPALTELLALTQTARQQLQPISEPLS